MSLKVSKDRIAMRIILLEVNGADNYESFQVVSNEDVTGDRHIVISGFVFE